MSGMPLCEKHGVQVDHCWQCLLDERDAALAEAVEIIKALIEHAQSCAPDTVIDLEDNELVNREGDDTLAARAFLALHSKGEAEPCKCNSTGEVIGGFPDGNGLRRVPCPDCQTKGDGS